MEEEIKELFEEVQKLDMDKQGLEFERTQQQYTGCWE